MNSKILSYDDFNVSEGGRHYSYPSPESAERAIKMANEIGFGFKLNNKAGTDRDGMPFFQAAAPGLKLPGMKSVQYRLSHLMKNPSQRLNKWGVELVVEPLPKFKDVNAGGKMWLVQFNVWGDEDEEAYQNFLNSI